MVTVKQNRPAPIDRADDDGICSVTDSDDSDLATFTAEKDSHAAVGLHAEAEHRRGFPSFDVDGQRDGGYRF